MYKEIKGIVESEGLEMVEKMVAIGLIVYGFTNKTKEYVNIVDLAKDFNYTRRKLEKALKSLVLKKVIRKKQVENSVNIKFLKYEFSDDCKLKTIPISKRRNKPYRPTEQRLIELRTMPHSEYLKTEEWQKKRKTTLRRAAYTCQLCGKKDTMLHVHHNNYDNLGEEYWRDILVLCDECHAKFHNK